MLALFKPNTYDPNDWQCPKPSCRTVNFKKRQTCISCRARRPDGTHRPLDDWRDGEKETVPSWVCDVCRVQNEAGSYYCMLCKKPSPYMLRMMEEERSRRQTEEGRGGGLYDRQDPSDRKQWDSDGEEFDEFGRRKKHKSSPSAQEASMCDLPAEPAQQCQSRKVIATTHLSDKQRAALERLKSKHAASGRQGESVRRRSRSRRR